MSELILYVLGLMSGIVVGVVLCAASYSKGYVDGKEDWEKK